MERTSISTQEKPRFVEEKERFGAKVREVFKSEPNLLQDEIEDIEYETNDGKTLSIRSLLPEGWKIVKSSFLGMDNPMDIVNNIRTIFQQADRYIYIPDLRPNL